MGREDEARQLTTADFDYELPPELVAQYPTEKRGASRMLVLDRRSGAVSHRRFAELPELLQPGDCLVFNNSKVFAARLYGRKIGGSARIEALLLQRRADETWQAMLRPGKRVKPGTQVAIDGSETARFEVLEHLPDGTFRLAFTPRRIDEVLEACGHIPLPPYIDREDEPLDRERYQTVYAKTSGSIAAPTAGLHFTDEVLDRLAERGIRRAEVTLHVGAGTFKPVATERIEAHEMHEEVYELRPADAELIRETKAAGGRIVAVGTTSVRTLESCVDEAGELIAQSGSTRIFLYPPYQPRIPDALLTNFHLPKSTLMMLIACFADRRHVLAAYEEAKQENYRFYSYGDCMLMI